MRIISTRTILGPNLYHHKPVMVMRLDLEEFTDRASTDNDFLVQRLLGLIPSLVEHHCSPGHPGGFVERLHRGTYFAHIIEHIALELSHLAGIGVDFGKAVYAGKKGLYDVWVRFQSEAGMRFLLSQAVRVAEAAWNDSPIDIADIVSEAKDIARKTELGPSTKALVAAAEKRNIPWRRVDDFSTIQLGHGKFRKFIQATTTSETSDIAVRVAQDKELTKKILDASAIRVPRGRVVDNLEEALAVFQELQSRVVVKPRDGNHGRGVSINLTSSEQVKKAFMLAHEHSATVIIEECFEGEDYRVVVVGGKLVAAAHRRPAHVTGDGSSNIKTLIEIENQNPLRGEGHQKPLTLITLDEEAASYFDRTGLSIEYVPADGEVVTLRETANLSTGGTADDVTELIHPSIKLMCERAARIIGLDVCGIDLVLKDISKNLHEQNGGVIEVNAGPGIRMHHYPSQGKARDVAGAIISQLYPSGEGRIPVISITGTNGKTSVTKMISTVLQQTGLSVGTTTSDGIYLNGEVIEKGDTTGPISARTILSDPSVEIAVLETARGGIVKRGLGYDWSDVGVITNIQPDHIGQDGIESIDDILWVKSLVVERVKPGGTIILNADSPELVKMVREKTSLLHEGRKLVYFSKNESEAFLQHINRGGTGYLVREGFIYECSHGIVTAVSATADFPITFNGTSGYQVENLLASLAALRAAGVSLAQTIDGLKSMKLDNLPGRTTFYRVGGGIVMLDYGHNPDAFLSVGQMAREWSFDKVTAVATVPGDRSDGMILFSGTALAHAFDHIILREDHDRRGRPAGQIAQLLSDSILKENLGHELEILLNPREALWKVVSEIKPGELVVYFYEDLEEMEALLKQWGAVQLKEIKALGGWESHAKA